MPDRKKVIKGLEWVYRCISPVNHTCGVCPYQDNHVECVRRVLSDAISLLKEQEPKAIEYHDNPLTGLPVAHCPNCMRYARQFDSSVEEETHFCPWCGQEVKWE